MKRKYFTLLFILVLASLVNAQTPEIADTNLPDIAMVTWFSGILPNGMQYYGPIILYNPRITIQVGPYLTEFFRQHEYAHIALNHIQEKYFLTNRYNYLWVSNQQELQADSYATSVLLSQGQTEPVRQAIQWFSGVQPFKNSLMHPAGMDRAFNIARTAASMGVNF